MNRVLAVTMAIALLCIGGMAQANVITCTYTGTGSGTLAGTPFSNSAFTITAVGDTANRTEPYANVHMIDNASTSIAIQGVGTYAFSAPTFFFSNLSFGVGIGSTASGHDLYNITTVPALQTWDMLSSIGPVRSMGYLAQWNDAPIHTSGGVLAFATTDDVPATFTAAVVPEPSSLLAVAGGLVSLIGIRRRARV